MAASVTAFGRPMMSKYDPVIATLAALEGPIWRTSPVELEKVLDFALPKAAFASRTWWAKGPWTGAGWDADLDRAEQMVTFRRQGASTLLTPADDPPILQRLEISPKLGAALIAGGVAVVVGLGAFAVTRFMRKRNS
jgi:hypothetical protein